jgi:hypothetical protein
MSSRPETVEDFDLGKLEALALDREFIHLDIDRGAVFWRHGEIPITRATAKVVAMIAAGRGSPVPLARLRLVCPTITALRVHVSRARDLLRNVPVRIVTINRYGYLMRGKLEVVGGSVPGLVVSETGRRLIKRLAERCRDIPEVANLADLVETVVFDPPID